MWLLESEPSARMSTYNPQITSRAAGDDLEDVDYRIKAISGKGLGLVATRAIQQGTKIIVEEPLILVPMPAMVPGMGFRLEDMISDIEAAFEKLMSDQKEVFLALSDHKFPSEKDQTRLLTILRSNAFNTGESHIGLFPKIARINHSCRPNAGNWWSEKTGRRVIFAARDIQEGEEITFSYTPLLKSTEERQARLSQYGFKCDCAACHSSKSSEIRTYMSQVLEFLEMVVQGAKNEYTYDRLASEAENLIELLGAEGLHDYVARAYHVAAVFDERRGTMAMARKWAGKELEVLQFAEQDSSEALATVEYLKALGSDER